MVGSHLQDGLVTNTDLAPMGAEIPSPPPRPAAAFLQVENHTLRRHAAQGSPRLLQGLDGGPGELGASRTTVLRGYCAQDCVWPRCGQSKESVDRAGGRLGQCHRKGRCPGEFHHGSLSGQYVSLIRRESCGITDVLLNRSEVPPRLAPLYGAASLRAHMEVGDREHHKAPLRGFLETDGSSLLLLPRTTPSLTRPD